MVLKMLLRKKYFSGLAQPEVVAKDIYMVKKKNKNVLIQKG